MGFLSASDGKESTCKAGDLGSIPGSGRSLGEGNCSPFLPREFHGQRNLEGYSPWGHKESETAEQRSLSHTHMYISYFFPLRRTKSNGTPVAASMPSTQILVSKSFPLKSKRAS